MAIDELYQRAPAWMQDLVLNAYAARITYQRRGESYRQNVTDLLESQYWPVSRLEARRDERIRAIVNLAYEKSPYYRRTMTESGLRPSDINGADDLARLPLISKETLRNHGTEMMTAERPLRTWHHGRTSGTTGSPTWMWYDRGIARLNDAVDWRQKVWGGMTRTDWIGILYGRPIVTLGQSHPPFWRVNKVHRQLWFSSYHMSDENLIVYFDEMQRRGLQFLEGFPSTLFILARFLVKNGLALPMKAVFSSAETMHETQRETIELAFGCRIFDFYGHTERTIFATECEAHSGKHLAEEYGHTEVVDASGNPVPDGSPGFLVGTSLHNSAMPMLRYLTGDISSIRRDPCECGRTLRRIDSVATKAEDIVITPDGRMISPTVLTAPFRPFHSVLKSQLIQDRPDHLLVKLVTTGDFTAAEQQSLTAQLAARLGPGVTIEVALVDDIPCEPSGKFRWVISRVPHSVHFSWN